MPAPDDYVKWINQHIGFNPRGQANSNALSQFVTNDVIATGTGLGEALSGHRLLPKKNINVPTRVATRNIDLAFCQNDNQPKLSCLVTVENKTIMAAHGKARKNRYGDIIAYCNHVHNHRRDCVAGAIVVVNTSPAYENPDVFAKGLVRPSLDMDHIVRTTIDIFAKIPLRDTPDDPNELPEALAVIVVDYDGVSPGRLVTDKRAPQSGNPILTMIFSPGFACFMSCGIKDDLRVIPEQAQRFPLDSLSGIFDVGRFNLYTNRVSGAS